MKGRSTCKGSRLFSLTPRFSLTARSRRLATGFWAQASVRKLSENKLRPNEEFHGRYAPQGTFTPPRCLKLHGSHLRRHREERPAADRLAAGCAGRGRADRRGACGEFGRDVAGLYRQLPRTGAPDLAAPDAGPLHASVRATL